MTTQTQLFDVPPEDEPHKHKKFLWKQITSEPGEFECHSGKKVMVHFAKRHVQGIGWVGKFYVKLPTEEKLKEFAKLDTVEQYLRTH